MNCFRYFGITALEDIEQMTLWEYNLRMRAYGLRMIDKEYELHLAAWTNREVEAKRKSGKSMKYVYTKWSQFFDYEKRIADLDKKEKPISIAEKLRAYTREKKDGQL